MSDMQPTTVLGSRLQAAENAQRIPLSDHRWNRGNRVTALWAIESLLDASAVCVSVMISYAGYAALAQHWGGYRPIHDLPLAALILACVLVAMLARSGAYRSSAGLLRIRETARVLEASFFSAILLLPCAISYSERASPWLLAAELPLITAVLILEKHAIHALFERLRRKGIGSRRVVIYGSGSSAHMLYSALARSPKLGLWPVAVVDDGAATPGALTACRYPSDVIYLNSASFCSALLKSSQADLVVIASRTSNEGDSRSIMEACASVGVEIAYAADTGCGNVAPVDYLDVDGHLIYGAHTVQPRYLYDLAMRVVDVVASASLLLLTAVPLLFLAVIIKLDSPGPVLFRQRRVGLNGRPFTILKFRTMHVDDCKDALTPRSSNDRRITRSGKWLRKTSLDELPQLLNVLAGDMALVGPRPEMPFIVAEYSEQQRKRLSVKPGLTGIWQLSADRSAPIHENIHYDLYYLKERSVAVDFAILLHTAFFAMNGI
jgi:exopolysaccharide biosynthesis polyprenyl glycosylphosphotransferase